MQKFKICFFIPFYPKIKGGAEYQSRLLADALKLRGYEIFFISGGHLSKNCTIEDGFKVYQLPVNSTFSEQITLYKSYMKKVEEILSLEKPTVIYQRILNTFTFRLSRYARLHKMHLILHIADNYSIEFGGKKGLLKKYLFDKIMESRPDLICQTSYQYSLIKKTGYEPAAVIPNMHPKIRAEGAKKDRNAVLWIGNARPVKQLEIYLELAEQMEESSFIFHVIGQMPNSEYGNSLLQKMDSLSSIRYHGGKDNSYINNFLAKVGVLVNTSVSEGFSNTFIQAWLSGTPVLSLNSDPDNIISKYNIGVYCKGNKSSLAYHLKAITTGEDYTNRSLKSKEVAEKKFSIEQNIGNLVSIIENRTNGEA